MDIETLTRAEETTMQHLLSAIEDDDWWLEQKLDGERLKVVLEDGMAPQGFNRIDKPVNVSSLNLPLSSPGRTVLDGELVSGIYYIFDISGHCLASVPPVSAEDPYHKRREALHIFNSQGPFPVGAKVSMAPCYTSTAAKTSFLKRGIASNIEGVILKKRNAAYYDKNSWYKFKFWRTIDAIVVEPWREGKRSASVALLDQNGQQQEIGSVSLTEKILSITLPGDVIEIKYLYATEDQKIYQPSFLRTREDKKPEECTLDQLRYTNKQVMKG